MRRGKHCTAEQRNLIKELISKGKTYKEVDEDIVGCSPTMICNALKYKSQPETRGRRPAMTAKLIKRVVRFSKNNPVAPATKIKSELELEASVETIRRRLREHNLAAHSPRKVPLLTKRHVAQRLKFANEHLDWPTEKWRNSLWTDESKIVLYGARGSRQYVRRPANSEYNPKYTTKTIKHGGSSIMIWACFSFYGVGPIYWIKETMDRTVYVRIMEEIMLPYAREEMPLLWVYDNDPKHTSKLVSEK